MMSVKNKKEPYLTLEGENGDSSFGASSPSKEIPTIIRSNQC